MQTVPNAQKSTGPKTPEGKLRSSQNNLRHGAYATSAVVYSIGETPEKLDAFKQSFYDHLQPDGPVEQSLVEEISMCQWRLARNRKIESGFLDHLCEHMYDQHLIPDTDGQMIAPVYVDDDPECPDRGTHRLIGNAASMTAATNDFITKLGRQEARLRDGFYRALKTLGELQKERRASHPAEDPAAEPATPKKPRSEPMSPLESTDDRKPPAHNPAASTVSEPREAA